MTVAVSAVIVNYNAGPHLPACLRSLAATLIDVAWEAVVVDNASTDGSAAAAGGPAGVRVLTNPENLGFARGANQGIAATTGPLVLILNPDSEALPGLVQALAAELAAFPACGVVGPRVLDPDGAVQGSARGDPTLLTGIFGRSSLLARVVPWLKPVKDNIRTDSAIRSGESSVEVDWVSGACMLARRAALDAIGGFDESFFLYWEDADLCRRLRARGYQVRYAPGARVVHVVGQSSRTARRLAIREFHRSAYRYYAKHVATSWLHPARWLAKGILTLRCWLLLLRAA